MKCVDETSRDTSRRELFFFSKRRNKSKRIMHHTRPYCSAVKILLSQGRCAMVSVFVSRDTIGNHIHTAVRIYREKERHKHTDEVKKTYENR